MVKHTRSTTFLLAAIFSSSSCYVIIQIFPQAQVNIPIVDPKLAMSTEINGVDILKIYKVTFTFALVI